jgi:antitoxin MazE
MVLAQLMKRGCLTRQSNKYTLYIHQEDTMAATRISNLEARAIAWGNGLGFRITKPLAEAAGIDLNTVLSVSAQPGRIVIEARTGRPSLDEMLAAFDPKRHGGEAMPLRPVGREVL